MTMPLDQWRHEISRHLELIEAGADMCASHAEQLKLRPAFETKAEAELDRCEAVLRRALKRVWMAQWLYRIKETGT